MFETWAALPFHFWSVVFFVFGAVVGSFLNVCIHRMPLGLSIVNPPSHCPHCRYSIPWYLNVPLVTWLVLRGRCAECKAPISVRYFIVELLTGLFFLGVWLMYGEQSVLLVLVYCVLISGLVVASFIDFEHFIIPDQITIGGIAVGFVFSLLVPEMHHVTASTAAMKESALGIAAGGGIVYAILRAGKFAFGRKKIELAPGSRVLFKESSIQLPDEEVPYEELFYRNSDVILLHAERLELIDRCYQDVALKLSPQRLVIGGEEFDPEQVPYMAAVTDAIVVPREAMGFGDVKFMAAIGAFLGWPAVLFALMASSVIGSVVGVSLIVLKKHEWSSRLPYGPYIALGAVLWLFGGRELALYYIGR
jgi:leader peptidase (prepilin peptidase) / N-methyltransferase